MFLGDFINNLDKKFQKVYFSGIAFDSKKVKKDNIFFAIKGNTYDGNLFIADAIKKGARVIISKKNILLNNKKVIFIRLKNPRKILAELSYSFIKKNLKD